MASSDSATTGGGAVEVAPPTPDSRMVPEYHIFVAEGNDLGRCITSNMDSFRAWRDTIAIEIGAFHIRMIDQKVSSTVRRLPTPTGLMHPNMEPELVEYFRHIVTFEFHLWQQPVQQAPSEQPQPPTVSAA